LAATAYYHQAHVVIEKLVGHSIHKTALAQITCECYIGEAICIATHHDFPVWNKDTILHLQYASSLVTKGKERLLFLLKNVVNNNNCNDDDDPVELLEHADYIKLDISVKLEYLQGNSDCCKADRPYKSLLHKTNTSSTVHHKVVHHNLDI
jgi:hypothetical protein